MEQKYYAVLMQINIGKSVWLVPQKSGKVAWSDEISGTRVFNSYEEARKTIESHFLEDFGFIGSVLVIALYLMLIYRMLKITLKSNNQFYTYISTGLIMMLLFHIFENIGAVTGLLPLTGIPLPFISQGGSAIISNLIGVGLLLSMSYQTNLAEEKSGKVRFKRKKVVLKRIK